MVLGQGVERASVSVHPKYARGGHPSAPSIRSRFRHRGVEEIPVGGDRIAKGDGYGLVLQAEQVDEPLSEISDSSRHALTLVS